MDKRFNTTLFIIAATVVNIVLMMLLFLVSFVIFARFLAPILPPGVNRALLLVLLIGSVVGTYVIYHRVMRWVSKRYNLDAHFSPLFRSHNRRRND